jgi:quinohemoprotein ethanol dehydrogenase
MKARWLWSGGVVLALLVVGSGTVAVQSGEDGATFGHADWPFVGGDWANSRYSTLDRITTANVKDLGAAWSFRFDGGASTRATPVVKNGVLFIGSGTRLYARDAATGAEIWTLQTDENAESELEAAGIGDILNAGRAIPSPPGVGLGDGMVFVGLMNGRVAAYRQDTGAFLWSTQIGYTPPRKGQAVSGAPIYVDGKVFTGLANGDWAFRGKAVALDATTGDLLWDFWTIPGPGDPGHETWPGEGPYREVWEKGGAGIWHVANADPELGLVYYVTGNAVPMFGGEARAGDNLYTASILAFDMDSGELRWHYQVVRHDLWDADIAIAPLLYDTEVDGQAVKGLAALRADGFLFLLNRETGEPILPIEERAVTQDPYNHTAATQLFPVGAESLLPGCDYWRDKVHEPWVLDCSGFAPPFVDRANVVAPGAPIPGARVTSMSYSPDTGYLYAQGRAQVGRAHRVSTDPWFRGGARIYSTLPPPIGILAAIDTRTNRIAWSHEVPPAALGTSGPMTTAGGLMFRGSGDGHAEAYDARTGERLWQFQTGVRGARGPAAAYEVGGEQYVALPMGPELWAFKLGGTVPENDAPPTGPVRRDAARATNEVQTTTLVQSAERGVGNRYAVDEHAFNPPQIRVPAGSVVTFINSGALTHTITALDRSWTTGTLTEAQSGYVLFEMAGTFTYHCEEHPWAMGQVFIEP